MESLQNLWSKRLNERLRDKVRQQQELQAQQKPAPPPETISPHPLLGISPSAFLPTSTSPLNVSLSALPAASPNAFPLTYGTSPASGPVGLSPMPPPPPLLPEQMRAKKRTEKELTRQRMRLAKLRTGPKPNKSEKRQWLAFVKNLLKPFHRNSLINREVFTEICKKVIKPYDFKNVHSLSDTMHELAMLTYYYLLPSLETSRKAIHEKAVKVSKELREMGQTGDPAARRKLQVKRYYYKARLEDVRRRIVECRKYKPASRVPEQWSKRLQRRGGIFIDELGGAEGYDPTQVQWTAPPDPRVFPLLPPTLKKQMQDQQLDKMKQLSMQVETYQQAAKAALTATRMSIVSEVTTPQEQEVLSRPVSPAKVRSRSRSASAGQQVPSVEAFYSPSGRSPSPAVALRSPSISRSGALRSPSIAASQGRASSQASAQPLPPGVPSPHLSADRTSSRQHTPGQLSVQRTPSQRASAQGLSADRRSLQRISFERTSADRASRDRLSNQRTSSDRISLQSSVFERLAEDTPEGRQSSHRSGSRPVVDLDLADTAMALALQRVREQHERETQARSLLDRMQQEDQQLSTLRSRSSMKEEPQQISLQETVTAQQVKVKKESSRVPPGPPPKTDAELAAEAEQRRQERIAERRRKLLEMARQRAKEQAQLHRAAATSSSSSSSSSEAEEVGSDGQRRMRPKRTKEERERRKLELARELREKERERVRRERERERQDRGHRIEGKARQYSEEREKQRRERDEKEEQEEREKQEQKELERQEREKRRQARREERQRQEEERRRRQEEKAEKKRQRREARAQARLERQRQRELQRQLELQQELQRRFEEQWRLEEELERQLVLQSEMEREQLLQRHLELEKERQRQREVEQELQRQLEEAERKAREREQRVRQLGKEKEEQRRLERLREKEFRQQERAKEMAKAERKKKALLERARLRREEAERLIREAEDRERREAESAKETEDVVVVVAGEGAAMDLDITGAEVRSQASQRDADARSQVSEQVGDGEPSAASLLAQGSDKARSEKQVTEKDVVALQEQLRSVDELWEGSDSGSDGGTGAAGMDDEEALSSDLDSDDYDPLLDEPVDSLLPSDVSVVSAQSIIYLSTRFKRRIKQVKLEPLAPTQQATDDGQWMPPELIATLHAALDEEEDEAFNTMTMVEQAERMEALAPPARWPRAARQPSLDISEPETSEGEAEGAESLFLGRHAAGAQEAAESDTEVGTMLRGDASEMGTEVVGIHGDQSVMNVEIGSMLPQSDMSETDDDDDEGGINDLLLTGDIELDEEVESQAEEMDEDDLTPHTGSEVEGLEQRAQQAGPKKGKRRRRTARPVPPDASSDEEEGADETERAAKRQRKEEAERLAAERAAQERRVQQLEWERKQTEQRQAQQVREQEAVQRRLEEMRKRQEQQNTMLHPIDIEHYYEEFVASPVVRITNLQRPFSNTFLKNVLALEDPLKNFWISINKAECYVEFTTIDGAKRLLTRMDGKRWPEHGKELRVEFADPAAFSADGQFVLVTDKDKAEQLKRRLQEERRRRPVPLETIFHKTTTTPAVFYMGTTPERVAANMRLARHIIKTLEVRPDKSWSDEGDTDESDEDYLLSDEEGADALLAGGPEYQDMVVEMAVKPETQFFVTI